MYRPRLAALLLTLAVPLALGGRIILGHNSLGLVPLFVGRGRDGWRLWRADGVGVRRLAVASRTWMLPASRE